LKERNKARNEKDSVNYFQRRRNTFQRTLNGKGTVTVKMVLGSRIRRGIKL